MKWYLIYCLILLNYACIQANADKNANANSGRPNETVYSNGEDVFSSVPVANLTGIILSP